MYENAIEIKSAVYRQTLFTSVNPREEIVKKKNDRISLECRNNINNMRMKIMRD